MVGGFGLIGLTGTSAGHGLTTARASGTAEYLLLTCIDYRIQGPVARFMDARGLVGAYDQVILAGASLGAIASQFPAWQETFWQHLDLAIQLHEISSVMVIDHRDCGAYTLVFNQDFASDPIAETAVHAEQMGILRDQILAKYPSLGVELYLMALDGSVEIIP